MEQTVKERLKYYLKEKKVAQSAFCNKIGVGSGYISSMRVSIQPDKLYRIATEYSDLNIGWLLTGVGKTFLKDEPVIQEKQFDLIPHKVKGSVPYYAEFPVSAGELRLNGNDEHKEEKPAGYMMIPNVAAESLFPVVGCSMLPTIKAGDVIGVNTVNKWDRVEPDKIYMIITNDERMLKRLRIDNEDDSILWCVSENYKEFKIYKNDIIRIYHVVYHGELL